MTGEIPAALQNQQARLVHRHARRRQRRRHHDSQNDRGRRGGRRKDLIVVTSRGELQVDDIPIKNFKPIGEFELPEYELQKLSFPADPANARLHPARDNSPRSSSARRGRSD